MANLIPMAGEGSRYTRVGYTLSKTLVPVSGMPMIIKAIRDMPSSDKWIFVVRQEHIDDYMIDELIKSEIKDAIIIPVTQTTEGQASTCMLAASHLNPDEELFIAACDNGYLYDKEKYEKLKNDSSVDSILWTFTNRETLRRNPKSFGWVRLGDDGMTIEDMSVKIPVSDNPYDDHAVVATFWFREAKDFIEAVNLMVKEDYRIKNEFYVDSVPIFMKKLGKRTVIFDVDYYFGWGTPKDLYDYQLIEYAAKFGAVPKNLPKEDKQMLSKLKTYFEQ